MDQKTLDVYNDVQQVLRHLMLSIAASSRADLAVLGEALDAASTNDRLSPMARTMLADLAAGAIGIAVSGRPKQ